MKKTTLAHCAGALLILVALAGCTLERRSSATVTGPVVTIAAVTQSAAAGDPLRFTVNAEPAPADDLTVHLMLNDDACMLAAPLPDMITILAGEQEATLSLQTDGDAVDCTVTVTIAAGDGYLVGDTATSASVMITVTDADPGAPQVPQPPQVPEQPAVTIAAGAASVAEGAEVSFTLTAAPAPASPLTINLRWDESGSFLTGSRPSTVIIPTSGTATVSASTEDDGTDEPNGSVTLTVVSVDSGSGYTVGSPSSATVTVTDDDGGQPLLPQVTIAAGAASVAEGAEVSFTLTAAPAPASPLTVNLRWDESGSFLTGSRPSTVIIPTSGTATVSASTEDDGTDEPNGSVTLTVVSVDSGSGYTVGSPSSATVTVTDDDVTVNVTPRPVVSISGVANNSVTEGQNAAVSISISPQLTGATTPMKARITDSETGNETKTYDIPLSTPGMLAVFTPQNTDPVTTGRTVVFTLLPDDSGNDYTVGTTSSTTIAVTDAPP